MACRALETLGALVSGRRCRDGGVGARRQGDALAVLGHFRGAPRCCRCTAAVLVLGAAARALHFGRIGAF